MQNTEASCEESERVIKKFKTSRSSLPSLISYENLNEPETSQTEFCLFSKLLEIHHEESKKNTDEIINGLKYSSFLLEKLVIKERLNTLILNLYPGNKGFSMAFRSIPRSEVGSEDTANIIETMQWPYEDDDILRHIDNEELPPTLVDVFEMHYSHLFYSGCIIAEIRDYRQAYPHSNCDIHHVLLRPTLKSIMSDINNIVETNNSASEEKDEWSIEERHMLESQILLADNSHICLDPDNTVCSTQLRLNHSRNMWNSHKFHRMARKFSQVTVNRKRKLDQFTHRTGLELYEYLNRVRTKSKSPNSGSKIRKTEIKEIKPIAVPNLDSPAIGPPSQGVVINEFKAYQPPVESNDYLPQIVEEYVLETKLPPKDKNKQRVYHIKLSILQRPSNSEYLGELYLDRDHKENERNGVACRFTLGTRMHVNKYLQQFSETFTKSGRQSVVMRRGGRNTNFKISLGQLQNAAQSSAQQKQQQQVGNQPQQQNQQVGNLPNHIINGIVSGGVNIVQNQVHTSTSSASVMPSHLQSSSTSKPSTQTLTNQQLEINALAIKLMNFGQEFQAAAHAKQQEQQRQLQQQQQQKGSTNANNTIINLLNSGPVSNINSEANTVVVNTINNSSLLPQQIQTSTQQKLLTPRKMTVMNLPSNARVIGHAGNLVVNNNRLADLNSSLSGQQTITLTSVNSNESFSYTAVPVKQQVISQRSVSTSNESNKQTALSALLVGTPAADRPDIVSSNNSSLLLEKLASSSSSNSSQGTSQSFLQNPNKPQQFVLQSSKINTVQSPMSSPQQTSNTINVQSLKLSQLQSLTGIQNLQVQLPGFSQPISLSSGGNIQGHPTGLLVSLPVTSSSGTSTISQAANNGTGVVNTGPTVVLANAAGLTSLAQLVSGMKNLNQQGIRQSVPATVSLTQGQQIQLITSLQGQRLQQANLQQNITRTIQRTPITIKMASTPPNTNSSQITINTNTLNQQLQKQVQLQQYQQLCLNQQQNVSSLGEKIRRRSDTSTDPQ
ncbi:transcription factor SPT20 homolog isoform X2 [Harmonia axyridis]|uniref:transcription factor SPT20 homolog isoform X2 n=1 Tax=Harmonia axyridis TaxID=115357 RepID=UPI001E2799FF|nr:transcription factor SPT20 homolog isoform X2 [Harmonia axyridis]